MTHVSKQCFTASIQAVTLVGSTLCSVALAENVHWTGWISDAKCGAKMTGYCANSCISAGEKPVFVTESKQVVPISNPER